MTKKIAIVLMMTMLFTVPVMGKSIAKETVGIYKTSHVVKKAKGSNESSTKTSRQKGNSASDSASIKIGKKKYTFKIAKNDPKYTVTQKKSKKYKNGKVTIKDVVDGRRTAEVTTTSPVIKGYKAKQTSKTENKTKKSITPDYPIPNGHIEHKYNESQGNFTAPDVQVKKGKNRIVVTYRISYINVNTSIVKYKKETNTYKKSFTTQVVYTKK